MNLREEAEELVREILRGFLQGKTFEELAGDMHDFLVDMEGEYQK